jgi:hypothetical protein
MCTVYRLLERVRRGSQVRLPEWWTIGWNEKLGSAVVVVVKAEQTRVAVLGCCSKSVGPI